MIKGGGSAAEAKTLADEFQALLLDVMFEKKEIKDENDIIIAKALAGHEEEGAGEAAERLRHQRRLLPELRPRAEEPAGRSQQPVDRRLPARSAGRLRSRRRPTTASSPGCWSFRKWGLERQLSADRRRYVDGAPHRHRSAAQGAAAEVPVRPRRRRRREAGQPQGQPARQPVQPRRRGAAPFPRDPVRRRAGAVHEGQRPPRARRRDPPPADRHARHRQSDLEGAFRHRARRHAEQLRRRPASGRRNPELLDYLAQRFVDDGMSIKELHREIMLSAVYQSSAEHNRRQLREGLRATGCTGARTAAA